MIAKPILYFDQKLVLICDAKCDKAWGNNGRPKRQLSEDEDDYEFLADGELGEAPARPGSWEGADTKPQTASERLNKWCCRECERSVMIEPGEDFCLPDFSKPVRNISD